MAEKYNINIDQGSTYNLQLEWKDENGTPIDLTGFTAKMQARYTKPTNPIAFELTTENGGIIIVDNKINLTVTATQTGALEIVGIIYDLELYNGLNITRLIEGNICVSKEVTK